MNQNLHLSKRRLSTDVLGKYMDEAALNAKEHEYCSNRKKRANSK